MITSIIAIIAALMSGHVVACITNGTHARFTIARWSDTGEFCVIHENGRVFWYSNLLQFWKHMRQAESNGIRYDAAIIDNVQEEQEFLAGREAAAKLIDPPPFLKLAA